MLPNIEQKKTNDLFSKYIKICKKKTLFVS